MQLIVKCPLCGEKLKIRQRGRYFFKHCKMGHDIEPNIISYGFSKNANFVDAEVYEDDDGEEAYGNENNKKRTG